MLMYDALDSAFLRNSECEQAFLGCCIGTKNLDLVSGMARPEWFFSPANKKIFEAVLEQARAGSKSCDLVLLAQSLRESGSLASVGGQDYLVQLAEEAFKASSAAAYAREVREAWSRRLAIERSYALIEQARQGTFDQMLAAAMRLPQGLDDSTTDVYDVLDVDLETGADLYGCESPFQSVNDGTTTNGWPSSQITLVSALKKAGKTSLMLQAAIHTARKGDRVLYATFEMSRQQLVRRIYKMITGHHKRPSTLQEMHDWESEIAKMRMWDLSIYDPTGSDDAHTVERLYNRCLELGSCGRLDLVCVDFVQKMRSNQKLTNRTAELEHVSWSLARLARRMPTTAFLVGSQVTMVDGEARTKGCTQLEEDCGLCILLKRDKSNALEMQITYNRFGKSWVHIPAKWNERTLTIEEGW